MGKNYTVIFMNFVHNIWLKTKQSKLHQSAMCVNRLKQFKKIIFVYNRIWIVKYTCGKYKLFVICTWHEFKMNNMTKG